MENEYIPHNFRIGLLVPLFKGGDKDPLDRDNYRDITLMSSLRKLFDNVLLARCKESLLGHVPQVQGASVARCSSMHSSYLLQEALAHNLDKGRTVFCCLLDIRKAFNTMWIDGLLYKLFTSGLNGKFWRIMYMSFKSYFCSILYAGMQSECFKVQQGVHQGGVMSMYIYQFYLADLLTDILGEQKGVAVGQVDVSADAFADDLSLLSLCMQNMNYLLSIVWTHSQLWRFELHPGKCTMLMFGGKNMPLEPAKLGLHSIDLSDGDIHVGIPLGDRPDFVRKKVAKAKRKFNSLLGLGSLSGGLNQLTATRLYWTFSMSTLLYGAPVIQYTTTELERMEVAHREIGRRIQRLPRSASNPVAVSGLGWMTIRRHIDKMRLMFFWGILTLPMNNIYKQVLIYRLLRIASRSYVVSSPVTIMWKTVVTYGLDKDVMNMITLGEYWPKHLWKSAVNVRLKNSEVSSLRLLCTLYSSLKWYELHLSVNKCQPNIWWKLSREQPHLRKSCEIMVQLITGCYLFNKEQRCLCCDIYCNDTLEHFLINCDAHRDNREQLYLVWTEKKAATIDSKIRVTLGIDLSYENKHMLHIIAETIFKMHITRVHLTA